MKYVTHWVDKKTGRPYCFFRRAGFPKVPLPTSIGSPEFLAAYHAIMRGEKPDQAVAEMRARSDPGSINIIVAQYLEFEQVRATRR